MRSASLVLGGLLVVSLTTQSAVADELLEAPRLGSRVSLSHRLKSNLSMMSNSMGVELSKLTLGLVNMRFDLHKKRARMSLGGGDPEAFLLHIDSNVLVSGSTARVHARIDLAIAGSSFHLDMPEFDMSTDSVAGERAVQLSLPLIEGKF